MTSVTHTNIKMMNFGSAKKRSQNLEEFLNKLGHELKTPLTIQIMLIEFLKKELINERNLKYINHLDKIHDQSLRISKLITSLMQVQRIG